MPTYTPTAAGTIGTDDIMQVSCLGSQEGQASNHVWYCQATSGTFTGNAASLALLGVCTIFQEFYNTNILDKIHKDYTLEGITVKKIQRTDADAALGQPATKWIFDISNQQVVGLPGLVTSGDAIDSFSAVTLLLVTSSAARTGRGSKRFGGIPESHVEGNKLVSTNHTAWTNLASNIVTLFATAVTTVSPTNNLNPVLVVPSLKLSGMPPGSSNDLYANQIINARAARVLGSQLSRKQKRTFA